MSDKYTFHFQQFSVKHEKSAMKVGTDAIVLGAWTKMYGAQNILDIGTGCGVLSLIMAQYSPKAILTAIDIDDAAIQETKENFEQSKWSDRLKASCISLQEFTLQQQTTFDLIVCNPPFFEINQRAAKTEQRTQARLQTQLSIESLLSSIAKLLSLDGIAVFIYPYLAKNAVLSEIARYQFNIHEELHFQSKKEKPIERILLKIGKAPCDNPIKTNLIHYQNNQWTEDYVSLTKDLHAIRS